MKRVRPLLIGGLTVLLLAPSREARAQEDKDVKRHMDALRKARAFADLRVSDSIGALGERAAPALPELARLLDHKEYYVRMAAQYSIQKLGVAASSLTPVMLSRLQDTSTAKRESAVTLLVRIAPADVRSVLDSVALNDRSPRVRRDAFAAVTAPSVLAEIVRRDPNLRMDAIRKLSDQRTLGSLASAVTDIDALDAITAKISDREVLLGIVKAGPTEARQSALARLPAFIVADLAAKDPDAEVRLDAAWSASDATVLRTVAEKDSHPAVRQAAAISARGKATDLKLTGFECKPVGAGGHFTCTVRIENTGSVAYTRFRFVVGAYLDNGGDEMRPAGTVLPGEQKELSFQLPRAPLGGLAQLKVVSVRKAPPS